MAAARTCSARHRKRSSARRTTTRGRNSMASRSPPRRQGRRSIRGVITDATGAVIPGATVSATNVATGVVTSRTTTGAGQYLLSPLAAGEYTVAVSAPGFRNLQQEHVIVDALATVGLDLK